MHLEIVTPEGVVFEGDIEEIIVPAANGQITILPNHVGLVTHIKPGEVIVKKAGKIQSLVSASGLLEVEKNRVTILSNYAVRAENIEEAKAKEAKERAERLMKEKLSEKDLKVAEAELIRALLELKIAGKYRKNAITP